MTRSKDGVDPQTRAILPPGSKISGAKVEAFTGGWAYVHTSFGKAHYFERRQLGLCRSICGKFEVPAAKLMHQGDFERCAICQRKRSDARKAGRL